MVNKISKYLNSEILDSSARITYLKIFRSISMPTDTNSVPSLTIKVGDDNLQSMLESTPGYVLMDAWAEWCTPCKMIAPLLDRISVEMKDELKIFKLDVDANVATAQKYSILSIPTMILFKDGEIKDTFVGYQPRPVLLQKLAANGVQVPGLTPAAA